MSSTLGPIPGNLRPLSDGILLIPTVLVALDADLVGEGPDEPRGRLLALAQRLLTSCGNPAETDVM